MMKNHTDYQPIVEHDPRPDTNIMYREMIERNKAARERTQKKEERVTLVDDSADVRREKWNAMTQEQQADMVRTLEETCNQLIQVHPDYKCFKKARVFHPVKDEDTGEILCIIHWNGTKISDQTGLGVMDREFPARDIPIVIIRYLRKIKYQTNKENDL